MSRGLDFLFVFLNTPYGDFNGFAYNIGTARIIWNLRKHGFSAEQYYRNDFLTFEETAKDILQRKPRFVGFSCFDVHFPLIADLASRLKKQSGQIQIAMGGPTAMFSDEVILRNYPQIDLCVRGEGEQTAVDLLSGVPFEMIRGISYTKDGTFMRNPDRPMMSDREMNLYPSVYADGLIPLDYSKKIGVMTSTGCMYRCTYCHFSVLTGRHIRFFSEDHILQEIQTISQFWAAQGSENVSIPILDEAFTINKERTIRLCREIERMGLPISFSCGTRSDHIDKEILEALSAAGVTALFFGLESGAPNVLANVRKARIKETKDPECRAELKFISSVKESVLMAKELGFNVSVSTIFGLPGETEKEAEQTLTLVEELDIPYMHNIIQAYRGTQLWNEMEEYGMQTRMFNNRWHIPHDTIAAYDIRRIPILFNQDRVFSNMRRNEIHAVLSALVGPEGNNSSIPSPVFMRAAESSSWKKSLLENHIKLGARLILCDIPETAGLKWLDDFIYPTSPPIILSSANDDVTGGMIVKRIAPLLNNTVLGYTVRLANLSKILSFNQETSCLSLIDNGQYSNPQATIMILGKDDISFLQQIARTIASKQLIHCIYSPELLVTMLADLVSITNSGWIEDGRICVGHDDCRVEQVALLFPELRPLCTDELKELDLFEATSFLRDILRAIRLLTFSQGKYSNLDAAVFFKPYAQGVLGAYHRDTFIYDSEQDTMKQFPIRGAHISNGGDPSVGWD